MALGKLSGFVAAFALAAGACSPAFAQAGPARPIDVPNAEQFNFHSKILDRDMLIEVAKPAREGKDKARVVYFTDGNMTFPLMTALEHGRAPVYLVGIGYADTSPAYGGKQRFYDLTHVSGPNNPGLPPTMPASSFGGGAAFERFIREELRPLIEARYPIDPATAVLAGYSLGGLFVAHILMNSPDAFHDYIIGDPTCLAEQSLIQQAHTLKPAKGGPRKVVIATAGLNPDQHKNCVNSLAKALSDPAAGNSVLTWEGADEEHGSFPPEFYNRALRYVLAAPKPAEAKSP